LTPLSEKALDAAHCLVIAKRHAPLAAGRPDVIVMGPRLEDTFAAIERRLEEGSVAVAVSGDAGIFSLMPRLRERFPDQKITVIPGVSALQSLCAALGETWEDARIVSVHGRDLSPSKAAALVAHGEKTIFFCGPERDPGWICRALEERDIDAEVAVGECLSYPEERVTTGHPFELAGRSFDPLSVVRVRNARPLPLFPSRLEDSDFLRSQDPGVTIPMTREEVRTIALDKLRLDSASVVWDIGAGTGSVSVACARLCPWGEVHAAERLPQAIQLLQANKAKFRAYNLFIHEGDAASLLDSLPAPTHVFVGGSGGTLPQILQHVGGRGENIRVVVSGVTLNTVAVAFEIMSGREFYSLDVLQVSVSRGKAVGDKMIMSAQNPVTLLSAWTKAKAGEGGLPL
jgi:precorrin-6Y C5,15-methyltransferase (decarboxylating)